MRAALIQMPVIPDKTKNIETACEKIREAAANGADVAVLPEMFCCPYQNECFRPYGEPEGGEAQAALSALAAELGIYLVGGTVPELEGDRVYNTCYVYGPRRQDPGQAPEGPPVRHRRARRPAVQGVGHLHSRRPDHHVRHGLRHPWGCASASTCGSRSLPGACACGGQRSSSCRRPST